MNNIMKGNSDDNVEEESVGNKNDINDFMKNKNSINGDDNTNANISNND